MREEGKSKKAKGEEYEENEVMEVEERGGEGSRGEKTGGKKARANRRYYETPRNNYYRVITRRA